MNLRVKNAGVFLPFRNDCIDSYREADRLDELEIDYYEVIYRFDDDNELYKTYYSFECDGSSRELLAILINEYGEDYYLDNKGHWLEECGFYDEITIHFGRERNKTTRFEEDNC